MSEQDTPERLRARGQCRYCGSSDLYIEMRLESRPIGSYSLSGTQMKFSASRWPYMVCDACKHVSRGHR